MEFSFDNAFSNFTPPEGAFFSECDAIIFVFDLTNKKTFKDL